MARKTLTAQWALPSKGHPPFYRRSGKESSPSVDEFVSAIVLDLQSLRPLVRDRFRWDAWGRCIRTRGITIDRPFGTAHPDYPSVIYPLDYGFIPDTIGADGEPVDAFVGSGSQGLVGLLLTIDHRQADREMKLLVDCTPPEIYTAHGFINYDRTLLEGVLVLRQSMETLWEQECA